MTKEIPKSIERNFLFGENGEKVMKPFSNIEKMRDDQ